MKKTAFSRYIVGGFIASLAVTALLFFILYIDRNEFAATNIDFLFLVDSITRIVFIIFSGVLISRLIVEEYNDKTITLMFTYPISRKKIILSKLCIILMFTFFFIILTRFAATLAIHLLNNQLHFIQGEITNELIFNHFVNTLLYDISASGVSLVSLLFGMRKQSTRTTIITAVIIAFLLGAGNGDLSIGSYLAVPATLAAVGLTATYFSIHRIERIDVL